MLKSAALTTIVLLLAGAAAAADSPIDKGSLLLDGSVFFQSQSGDLYEDGGESITSWGAGNGQYGLDGVVFELSPTLGYFVAPGVFVGGQFSVYGVSQDDDDLTIFAIGPTLGYFFNANTARTEVKGAVYPYVRGFFNYASTSNDLNDNTILQYGGKGGLLYMLSSAVAVDASVRFQADSWDLNSDDPEIDSDAVTGTTLSIGLGFTAFIY